MSLLDIPFFSPVFYRELDARTHFYDDCKFTHSRLRVVALPLLAGKREVSHNRQILRLFRGERAGDT